MTSNNVAFGQIPDWAIKDMIMQKSKPKKGASTTKKLKSVPRNEILSKTTLWSVFNKKTGFEYEISGNLLNFWLADEPGLMKGLLNAEFDEFEVNGLRLSFKGIKTP